jgi:hypothetical protein
MTTLCCDALCGVEYVLLEQVVAALEAQCGVYLSDTKMEVTLPPYDFLFRFISDEDCPICGVYLSDTK